MGVEGAVVVWLAQERLDGEQDGPHLERALVWSRSERVRMACTLTFAFYKYWFVVCLVGWLVLSCAKGRGDINNQHKSQEIEP